MSHRPGQSIHKPHGYGEHRENSCNSTVRKQTTQLENGKETDISPKKVQGWQISTQRDACYQEASGQSKRKRTRRDHSTPAGTAETGGDDAQSPRGCRQRRPSHAGGSAEMLQPPWKTVWLVLQKLNLHMPCDPAVEK